MSQVPYQPPPGSQVYVQQAPSNGLGIAGFVTSLIGVVTCGFLSPVGLLFSLFGLMKRPRGLAIAGTVLGLLGSAWLFFVGFTLVLGFLGLSKAVNMIAEIESTRVKGRQAAEVVEQERDRTGMLPGEAAGNQLVSSHTDFWNRPFRYKRSGETFTIVSFGADGKEGTGDDLSFAGDDLLLSFPTTSPTDEEMDAGSDSDVEADTTPGTETDAESGAEFN